MKYAKKYKDCLDYIDSYWDRIIFKPSTIRLKYRFINIPTFLKDRNNNPQFLFVPYTYFVPNLEAQKRICYWDSFFMFRGLMGTKRQALMRSMVNNLIYLFKKYNIIPNFNAPASINRSQPPFLTSMILDAYLTPLLLHSKHKYHTGFSSQIYKITNKGWLKNAIASAKKEYETVWIDKANLYNHRVKGYELSRYGDRDIGYAHSSELESGWDMTSRFYNRCDQFLPIDLNVYLYKYELDFAEAGRIVGDMKEVQKWTEASEKRKEEINRYMWDENNGFFYDYGYSYKRPSNFLSLASYTPMWAGLATHEQAKRMVEKLPKFETKFGLTISAKESLAKPMDLSKIQRRYHPALQEILSPKQWDYPNIWSPLEYLTVIGLLKYGYIVDAKRIMTKSLRAHSNAFAKYKTLFEKLDGETGEKGKRALYGDQDGFGWTNAVFYRYVQLLDVLDTKKSIYVEHSQQMLPPYTISVLH